MIAAAAAVAVTLPLVAACGTDTPRSLLDSIKNGHVVLGTKFDQPGLAIQNPDKSQTGSDVQVSEFVVNQIAKNNGWAAPKITWKETPSPLRERMIENGEVDMIAATYSISKPRKAKADFAGPYLLTYQALLVRKNAEHPIKTLTDLNSGRKLCSVSGSTSALNVQSALPNVQLQQYDGYASCVEGVRRGVLDALTTDATILAGFQAKYPGEFDIVPMTYPQDTTLKDGTKKKKGDQFSTERYGIGIRKGDGPAMVQINRALEQMTLGEEGAARFAASAIPSKPTCQVSKDTTTAYTEAAYADPNNRLFQVLRENLGEYATTMIDQGRIDPATGKPASALVPTPGDQTWLLTTATPTPAPSTPVTLAPVCAKEGS
ncbi:transporter substrate-binding domain-containing protein [Tsukamurella sp. NPDC003166]|uniref:transporter substrate-binding domain-containing protein n=1 Tax=Tsukamurella sp. NPDC003166 TaxID=3154444 RepID=UPI0033ABD2CA